MSTKRNSTSITIPIPVDIITTTIGSLKEKTLELYMSFIQDSRQERIANQNFLKKVSLPKFNKKKSLRILAPILLVSIAAFVIFSLLQNSGTGQVARVVDSNQGDVKTVSLNREFKFPLKDNKGKEVGKLSYKLESAELRKQIIVKGKRATAVDGRTFLIVNLKISNVLDQGLEVNSRDYIRVSVNGDTKQLFAPDIHNDPVEVQAISTKNTRVGLAINENDRDIKLQIGEINGEKTIIPISF